ncbi:MAG: aminopeptidase P family protein [Clostridia bacterium]|nr:aminopeptidase P family protein [Clostridia bacterium]
MENGRKLFAKAQQAGFDGAVLFDEVSQHWATGFPFTDGVVIVCEKETLMLTDSRYIEAARSGVYADVRPILFEKSAADSVAKYVKEQGIKTLAFDSGRMTVSQLRRLEKACEGVRFEDVPALCDELRRVKTAKEIENVRIAQSITDAAFTHICEFIRPGLTELDVAAELEYFMRKNGADGLAFETIAVSGKKSSLPHGVPGKIELTNNSFLTMDYGARYNGYCSDMTRTVVLGKADDEMKLIYNTVLQAQTAAIAAMHAGATGKEVDAAARDIIKAAGYGAYFGHGTGHSLGLEIHESPNSSPRAECTFEVNQFQTVEPGIYLEGKYGVRIEDLVLVTENGCEDLTKSKKELIEL